MRNLKFKVMFNFLMYSDRTGMDKNYPEQNLPDKDPRTKTRALQTTETEFVQGGFCTGFLY